MARTYNDIYYNDDENSTAEILDDMKKLAESVDQQIGSIKSFNNDTSQFIEQVTPLMNTLSEQVIDMHQLADTMFTELEQVKEENKQLREDLNGLPKGQASGESIDLNDSAEMRCELKISGNSEQESTTGKNLFKPIPSATRNGITFTNNGDGSYTLNGTATAPISFYIVNVGYGSGTYALSANNPVTNSGIILQLETSNGNKNIALNAINKTLIANCDDINVLTVIVSNGTTLSNFVIKPQLELGSSVTDFEPYTNGASPNPDYPSEVECCGDNINIFDGEVEEGDIDASTGQNTAVTNAWRSKNYLNVKDTSVSISVKDLTFSGTVGRLYFYKSDNTYISNILINSLPFTATLPNETAKVRFFILNSVADINAKIKLEKGSTVTPYSPYGQGCINETICNKNLFDISNNTVTASGLTAIIENGIVSLGGTSTSTSFLFLIRNKLSLKAGTYTISTFNNNISSDDTTDLRVTHRNGDGVIARAYLNNTNVSFTFTLDTDLEEGCLQIRSGSGNTFNNFVIKPQLELGSSATSFVPHQEQNISIPCQQPMKSIGNVRDKFILKENGKWYERHNLGEVILNGTETWYMTNDGNFKRFSILINTLKQFATRKSNLLSNYFVGNITGAIGNMYSYDKYVYLYPTSDITSIDSFKTWLSTHNVKVYSVLEIPTDIECTSEQTEILNQMYIKAKSYKGVTHMYSTDKISSYKEVTYKKDIETLFANTLVEGV